MMRKIAFIVISMIFGMGGCVLAQEKNVEMPMEEKIKFGDHLNLGVSVGTIGINLDAEMPVNKSVSVRAGLSLMPKFTVPMRFYINNYGEGEFNWNKFYEARDALKDLTGFVVNEYATVNGKPSLYTANVLCDIYPFKKKNWHVTAGFYIGPKKVATCVNKMGDMPSLVSMGIYNGLHDYVMETDFIETPIYDDYYLDPDVADKLKAKFGRLGRMAIHAGDYNDDGRPYIMEPDEDGTVSAKAFANIFRPYLGFGYSGDIDKEKRIKMSFDCGAMFWGGVPDVIDHQGTNLSHDVHDIPGDAGKYMKIIQKLHVYPVLNFRVSYRIF